LRPTNEDVLPAGEITDEDAAYLAEFWFQWETVEGLAQALMAEVTYEAVDKALEGVRTRLNLGGALLVERRGDWGEDAGKVQVLVRHAAVSGPTREGLPPGPVGLTRGEGLLGDAWQQGGAAR
jgi:hypothetical protein